jgi:1-acyl-sn-glycerol-3-phosphate acyltransferase
VTKQDREIPKSNMFLVRLAVFLSRAVFTVYFRLECEGCARVRQVLRLDRPVITVMNHASSLDPLVTAACTGADFVGHASAPGKRELFESPLTGWLMRALGFFPVDRDILDLTVVRTLFRILRAGRSIGIAPEGTRTLTGEVLPFKSGFVKLALKTDTPIFPVGVQGTHDALPKGSLIPRPKKIIVRFGELIDLKRYIAEQPEEPTEDELAEMIRQEVIRLSGGAAHEPAYPSYAPGS